MPTLFDPLILGAVQAPNRVVMAPLTRLRAQADGTPSELNIEYYAQRASVGLLTTEGTYPATVGKSYPGQAGIVDDAHAAGWARVAEAVHAEGGRLSLQIMHGGRVSHPAVNGGEQPVGPSAIAPGTSLHLPDGGKEEIPVPRELSTDELAEIRDGFAAAARRAVDAGIDLVELHGANGYLLHQFLSPGANQRTDDYGGSAAARAAFPAEVVRAVVDEVGADRTAIRLSPGNGAQGTAETDPQETEAAYRALLEDIGGLGLAYISLFAADPEHPAVAVVRELFDGPLLLNTGWTQITDLAAAREIVESGAGDAAVVGRSLIANPDLVRRWAEGLPVNEPDPSTFYTHDAAGYTDYPMAVSGTAAPEGPAMTRP
ncbi:alkene reductase [Kocuria palustris]|uniref:alkene reductase n=1 Tax=Kocuria palustris TaxID=71999 RepID=UPI0011A41E69|nr:alkene reductase [Kocuria palustris]